MFSRPLGEPATIVHIWRGIGFALPGRSFICVLHILAVVLGILFVIFFALLLAAMALEPRMYNPSPAT